MSSLQQIPLTTIEGRETSLAEYAGRFRPQQEPDTLEVIGALEASLPR